MNNSLIKYTQIDLIDTNGEKKKIINKNIPTKSNTKYSHQSHHAC